MQRARYVEEIMVPIQTINIDEDSEEKIFKSICNQRNIIPSISYIRSEVEKDLTEHPLLAAVSRIDLNEKIQFRIAIIIMKFWNRK